MLYRTPEPRTDLAHRLDELDQLRGRLDRQVGAAGLWLGTLRRLFKASSIASSTSIEGFHVPADEAVAVVDGQPPGPDENRKAVAGYARAMEHVGVMTSDEAFRWSDRAILDLHFDACHFQQDKSPGRWRTGPVGVTGGNGELLYQAPEADHVPALMDETVAWLEYGDLDAHLVVRAAMAHLHIVSIHPFRDGNGRMSRIVQSLVLARGGALTPEFASIEEYLRDHTPAYYEALRAVQAGSYRPERDATPWIEFCVQAHIEQACRRIDQLEEAAARWRFLEQLAESRGWPDRFVIALEQALIGGTDRGRYSREADISHASASNDFRRLVDAGLIRQQGRGRSIRYEASDAFRSQVEHAFDSSRHAGGSTDTGR